MRIGSLLLAAWLIVGAIAAGQRHYYRRPSGNCTWAATVALTVAAGPLNYVGLNPKFTCHTPQPSK